MSKLLQDVVGELSKLPGVGRRTALRLAIHILRMERESVAEMTESIDRFRNDVKYCAECNNLSDEEVCPICLDDERDRTTICVVEQVADVLSTMNRDNFTKPRKAQTSAGLTGWQRVRAVAVSLVSLAIGLSAFSYIVFQLYQTYFVTVARSAVG